MTLTDPNLVNAVASINAAQPTIDGLNTQNADLTQRVSDLTKEVNLLEQEVASQSSVNISSLFSQFSNLQSKPGWVLAPSTAGNTGQKGSGGTATFTNSGDISTIYTQPSGPYYDCFYYRHFAGNGTPIAMPNLNMGMVIYHSEFMVDAANFPLAQALEMDSSWYYPNNRFQAAAQIEMHTKTLRYFTPGSWHDFPVPVPVPIVAGQWMPIDVICHFDIVNAKNTYLGVAVNNKFYQQNTVVNVSGTATAKPYAHTSVQADSNSKGQSYKMNVKNVGIFYL